LRSKDKKEKEDFLMKVYLNNPKNPNGKRIIVEAVLIKETEHTVTVCLPDGSIVKRKKKRDIVGE
jgi:hypothetical protein